MDALLGPLWTCTNTSGIHSYFLISPDYLTPGYLLSFAPSLVGSLAAVNQSGARSPIGSSPYCSEPLEVVQKPGLLHRNVP